MEGNEISSKSLGDMKLALERMAKMATRFPLARLAFAMPNLIMASVPTSTAFLIFSGMSKRSRQKGRRERLREKMSNGGATPVWNITGIPCCCQYLMFLPVFMPALMKPQRTLKLPSQPCHGGDWMAF